MPLPVKDEKQWSEPVGQMGYGQCLEVAKRIDGGMHPQFDKGQWYVCWWSKYSQVERTVHGYENSDFPARDALRALAIKLGRWATDSVYLGKRPMPWPRPFPTPTPERLPPEDGQGGDGIPWSAWEALEDAGRPCARCHKPTIPFCCYCGHSPEPDAHPPSPPGAEGELDDCQRCTHDQEPPCDHMHRCNYLPT